MTVSWRAFLWSGLAGNVVILILVASRQPHDPETGRTGLRTSTPEHRGPGAAAARSSAPAADSPRLPAVPGQGTFFADPKVCKLLCQHLIMPDGTLNAPLLLQFDLPDTAVSLLNKELSTALDAIKIEEKKSARIKINGDQSTIAVQPFPERLKAIRDEFGEAGVRNPGAAFAWAPALIKQCSLFSEGLEPVEVSAFVEGGRTGAMITKQGQTRTTWDAEGINLLRNRYGHLIDVDRMMKNPAPNDGK